MGTAVVYTPVLNVGEGGNMFILGRTSAKRLRKAGGVHPLLVACVCLALRKYAKIDFGVGKNAVRTLSQQKRYLATGRSKTLRSKHLPQYDGFSHAVDLYPVGFDPDDDAKTTTQMQYITEAMLAAASDLGIELTGGFNWGWDLFHFQIKRIK